LKKNMPAALILLAALLQNAVPVGGLPAYDMYHENSDKPSWGVRLSGGLLKSAAGSIDMTNSSADVLDTGPGFSLSVSKRVSERFSTEITAGMGWMDLGDELHETSSNFSLGTLVLSNSYSLIRTGRLDMLIIAGGGMYYWRICREEVFGEARQFEGEDLQKISIGLKAGVGAEFEVSQRMSLTAESAYNYILCRDTFHFGRGFTEQGIINFNLGIRYYIR